MNLQINPEMIVAASAAITVVTQVLKVSPLPVNSNNAKVVALVLAVIVVLVPAYLNNGLSQATAGSLVASILLVEGAAVGFYESIKHLYLLATHKA